VEEFALLMRGQLDMRHEAQALRTFRHNFGSDKASRDVVTFPEPVTDLCTKQVLVEEFQAGEAMGHYLTRIRKEGRDSDEALNERIAKLGLHAILKMIFEDNYIHADLHAGNIIVRLADFRNTDKTSENAFVSLIDAGLVAELSVENRRNLIDLFSAIISNEGGDAGR
tara:strand:- start:22 stop:525 length:504 start_codon:yes stop_codon:yes gene_type:complete